MITDYRKKFYVLKIRKLHYLHEKVIFKYLTQLGYCVETDGCKQRCIKAFLNNYNYKILER
jgi:hypothetical protein